MALYGALAVLAAGAGKVIAFGTVTPTSAAETVVTGLSNVDFSIASLRDLGVITHDRSGADVGDQAGSPAAGSIIIRSQKPTDTTLTTPIPATTPWVAVDWIAIGDPG